MLNKYLLIDYMSEWIGLFKPHSNPLGRYQYLFSQGEMCLDEITQLVRGRAWKGLGRLALCISVHHSP